MLRPVYFHPNSTSIFSVTTIPENWSANSRAFALVFSSKIRGVRRFFLDLFQFLHMEVGPLI